MRWRIISVQPMALQIRSTIRREGFPPRISLRNSHRNGGQGSRNATPILRSRRISSANRSFCWCEKGLPWTWGWEGGEGEANGRNKRYQLFQQARHPRREGAV